MVFRLQNYLPRGRNFDLWISILNSWKRLGYLPNTKVPRTFNELFLSQKRNFNGNLELAKRVTDKVLVKDWLEELGLSELVVKTIAVCHTEAELSKLRIAGDVIIKPTHSSGSLILRTEEKGEHLSQAEISQISSWLDEDYYRRSREINYEGLEPKIIFEEVLRNESGHLPEDYKVFCCYGKPFLIQVDLDRFTNHTRQLYSPKWELQNFCMGYERNNTPQPKPKGLQKALEYCHILAKEFRFSRVDFYILNENEMKLGEITFFPGNAAERFVPVDGDMECGRLMLTCENES